MGNRLLLGFSVIQQQARKHLDGILAYFGLAVAYLIIYRDVVFFPKLIAGIDFQIRSSIEPWRFYYTDWSIWSSLGSRAGLGWTNWGGFQNAIFGAISFGNEVLAQKLLLSGILVASFTMFFFLKNHVTKITPVAFTGAILYAYSPLTTINYGTGIVWALAYLPIVINYLVNMFREKASFKDCFLFAITLSFMIGFGAHVLPFVMLTIPIFSLAFFPTSRLSIGRFVLSLKYMTLATFLFIILNPGIVMTAIYLFLGRTMPSPGYTGLASVDPQTFIAAYAPWTVLEQLTLMNWLSWGSGVSIGWKPLGVIFSMIAFASLLFRLEKDLRKLVYALSTAYILVILFVLNVQAGTDFFQWIFTYFPFIQIMGRHTAGPSWYMGFVLATLIAVTISQIGSRFVKPRSINRVITSTRSWSFTFLRQTLFGRLKLISLLLMLLSAYFVYVPSFSPTAHIYAQGYFRMSNSSEPIPNPPVYTMIVDFMKDKGPLGSFRYFLVPYTFLAGSLSNANPYIFGPSPSLPTPQVMKYMRYVESLIVKNETNNLGALLAPANVKYIFVIQNSTEPDQVAGSMEGTLRQLSPNGLHGDPQAFDDFLSRQIDLRIIARNQYFIVYENLNFLPYITGFSSMTYVLGDLNAIPSISTLPHYHTNNTLIFFGDEDLAASQSALDVSSYILFHNRGTTDFLMSFMFHKYGISISGLGTTNTRKVAEEWVWVDDTLSDTGFFTYGNGHVETTSDKPLEIRFYINSTDSYGVWLRVLYSPYSEGSLSFKIDGMLLEKSSRPQIDTVQGFVWINLGNFTLSQGQHNLTVYNRGGYNALSGLIVAPIDETSKVQNLVLTRLSQKQLLYLYDVGTSLVKASTMNVTRAVGGIWGGGGNFSLSADRVVGNHSYLSEVIAEPQNIRALIGSSFSSVENWNDEDFVQIWVKSSTRKLQFYLYSDKGASNVIAYWEFAMVPDIWMSLVIPLDHYNYGKVGAFQVHAVASKANETVKLYVNQVSVGRILETSYTTSTYLPPGEYSVAIKPSSKINASLIDMNLGGNILRATNESMNWITSGMVVLEGGRYDLTLTLPGNSKIEKVAIVTGSLHALWNKDESLALNYTKEGYSSYSVTTNSKVPFFIVLSEAFDVGWQASFSDQKVIHFKAFSFTNAFYVPATGLVTLKIAFSPSTYSLLNRIALTSLIVIMAILVVNTVYRKKNRHKSMGSK